MLMRWLLRINASCAISSFMSNRRMIALYGISGKPFVHFVNNSFWVFPMYPLTLRFFMPICVPATFLLEIIIRIMTSPCNFYLEVLDLESLRFSSIEFLSDDDQNPCVSILLSHGGTWNRIDFKKSIGLIVHAMHFILSRSTFALAMAFLSRHENKYTFGYPWSDIGTHWNCVPTAEYHQRVLQWWMVSPSQIELMKNSKCRYWKYIKANKTISYPHHGDDRTPFWMKGFDVGQ